MLLDSDEAADLRIRQQQLEMAHAELLGYQGQPESLSIQSGDQLLSSALHDPEIDLPPNIEDPEAKSTQVNSPSDYSKL